MDNSSVTIYGSYVYPVGTEDYIMRVKRDNTTSKFEVSFIEKTREFRMKILNPFFENIILRKSLSNLWNAYKYDQEYISFLLETTTKEEFLRKAEDFAKHFEEIDKDQLYYGANLLLNILDQPLTSADISLFFNIDPNTLESNDSPLLENKLENTNSK